MAMAASATQLARGGITLTTLCSLPGSGSTTSNITSKPLLVGDELYGVTSLGGLNNAGYVFSVPVNGGSPTVLCNLASCGLSNSRSSLTLVGNTLFGTAMNGINNGGGVFSVPITGGTPSAVATFPSTAGGPEGDLLLANGNLYGTFANVNGYGGVYSLPVTGGTPNILATFNGSNGTTPTAGMVLSNNTLYGFTCSGGAFGGGTAYSLPLTGGTPTLLASLNSSSSFWNGPSCTPLLLNGVLYGTSERGGAYGEGYVFSVPAGGGPVTILGSMTTADPNPRGSLTLIGNQLYGTTGDQSLYSYGDVFSVPVSGGALTDVADFLPYSPSNSLSGLTLANNVLYGTTAYSRNSSSLGGAFSVSLSQLVARSSTLLGESTPSSAFGNLLSPTLLKLNASSKISSAAITFSAASSGYVDLSDSESSGVEIMGLTVNDSDPSGLTPDLSQLIAQIDSTTACGCAVSASTVDPDGIMASQFPGNTYNFFVTFGTPNGPFNGNTDYLAFDFTQLDGTTNTLSATGLGVVLSVPEPSMVTISCIAIAGWTLSRRPTAR
jgi:uncharacterized repeat protein (TIGR03803 family)